MTTIEQEGVELKARLEYLEAVIHRLASDEI
jgi:hypothetical protein